MSDDVRPEADLCLATRTVLDGRGAVRWMVRGEPRAPRDTGWQIMSHVDTSEYLDDPDNWAIVEFDALCEIQPALAQIRDLPVGSDLQIVRDERGTRVVDTPTGREVFDDAGEPEVPPMIRQGQILQEVGSRLAADLPEGYDALEAKIRILGGTGGYSADLVKGDRRERIQPNPDVFPLMDEHRELAYRPGTGTWYTATIVLTADGGLDAQFDYDNEPELRQPVAPEHYREDARRYPRDIDHVPMWLLAKMPEM